MTAPSSLQVTGLRCEYADNPLGIDARAPRFSWQLHDNRRGQSQTAYQVLVASTLDGLAEEEADKWDSGMVLSSEQVSVTYTGAPLASGERCFWKLRAWDDDGQPSAWSDAAWFEMGLLDEADWSALWYGYPAAYNGRALFFRSFINLEKPVQRARAYVAGLGLYEFYVNGVKATNHVLEPAQTDYARRVFYTTIDIGPLLRSGRNGVGVIAGNGWHGAPKIRVQVHVEYEDGTVAVLRTAQSAINDPGWAAVCGPILANSIFDGEVYDARLELPGWCDPDATTAFAYGSKQRWMPAVPVDAPAGRMQAQPVEPIRVVQRLSAVALSEVAPGIFVYDMGQNMVGWVRLRVQGVRGTAVTLRFAENLAEDGTVDQGNLRTAACADTYILKGEGVEVWEPRFTYHGFRYVQVESYPGRPDLASIDGCVVHSDVATRGHFKCSNELLNRLQRAVEWTESGNLHGLPTDCPQRDERMGWLNDMTVRAEEAHYNFDVNRLHAKWIADIHDEQDEPTGAIPDTAPYRFGARPADPVTMCYLLVPWLLVQHHGNRQVMAEHYEGFRAWVDYLGTRAQDDIVAYSYYGDWSPPVGEAVHTSLGAGAVSASTPGALMSTGYYYLGARLVSQMAAMLAKPDDAYAYGVHADRIRAAYNRAFWDEQKQVYGSGNQACCSFTLYMGLAPEERRATVLDTLVRDIESRDYHLTTGNLCSKYLLEVLSAMGRHDMAYRLATQTTYPSWGYMLACGATTIWERWEHTKETGMHSKNHPMMATFSAWFYRYLAGIQVGMDATAFDVFTVRPHLAAGLDHVEASVETVRGRVECSWRRNGGHLWMRVAVPVNSTVRIGVPVLANHRGVIRESGRVVWRAGQPGGRAEGIRGAQEDGSWVTFSAGSGSYEFEVSTQED